MNKDNAKDYLPFVIALSEGKTIQRDSIKGFTDLGNVVLDGKPEEYRIKPELIEFYAIVNDDADDILSAMFKTKKEAEEHIAQFGYTHYTNIVLLREVK